MKQKVVIRVQMDDAKKRAKAMKKAVGVEGVLSAAIEGADKNQIVVIGDGVDCITLTTTLRKHMGFAELISVSAVEEKKPEKKPEVSTVQPMAVWPSYGAGGYSYTPQYCYAHEGREHYQDPGCCIM